MYQNLTKVSYISHEEYEKTYQQYFNSPATIRFDFQIKNNQAFLLYCPDITNLIFDIMNLNSELNKLMNNLPSIAMSQYAYNKLIDEIHLTNEIEGVRSTRKEISDILNEKEPKNTSKRFYNLVKKYEKLMKHPQIPLNSCQDIRKLYDEIVLQEVLEEDKNDTPDGIYFRSKTVFVYDLKMNKVHEGLFPEEKIIDVMTKSLALLKDPSINKLISIAILHYMIGYIHPFYNGNGRLSRFISSYLLSESLNYLVSYALSGTIKQDRNHYNKMFEEVNNEKNRGDLTPFVIKFLEILKKSLNHLVERISDKCETLTYSEKKLRELYVGSEKHFQILFILLQNTLFGFEGMSIKDLMEITEESRPIVTRVLQENASILSKKKSTGRKILYEVNFV